MRWSKVGARRLVQIRTRTLDGTLHDAFTGCLGAQSDDNFLIGLRESLPGSSDALYRQPGKCSVSGTTLRGDRLRIGEGLQVQPLWRSLLDQEGPGNEVPFHHRQAHPDTVTQRLLGNDEERTGEGARWQRHRRPSRLRELTVRHCCLRMAQVHDRLVLVTTLQQSRNSPLISD